jgi:hypothetical protein
VLTLLSQLFVTERHRLRGGEVGHSVPLASEVDVGDRSIEPLMISTTRGTFLESRVAKGGYARFGFSECGIAAEAGLVQEFHRVLVARTEVNGWPSLVGSVDDALRVMLGHGVKPGHLVAGAWLEPGAGVPVLDGGFPGGTALLVAEPAGAGLHTRVGDYVGILAYRVDRCFVAVVP